MDTKNPVGENSPPQFSAPQNAQSPPPHKAGEAAPQAPTHAAWAPQPGETHAPQPPCPAAGTPPAAPPEGEPCPAASPAGQAPAEAPPELRHGQPLPAMAGAPAGGAAAPFLSWPGAEAARFIPARVRQPFTATGADGVFAIGCFVLGFLFIRWVAGLFGTDLISGTMQGWGVTAFCLAWGTMTLAYARARKLQAPAASWYWLIILQLCGLSFALWPAGLLGPFRALLVTGAGVYWCGSLLGLTLAGKTSNLLPLDAINLLFVVPVRNMGCAGGSLKALGAGRGAGGGRLARRVLPVAVGLVLCVPLLAVVVPLLASADAGNFGRLLENLNTWLQSWQLWDRLARELPLIALQLAFGVPVGLYFFGLIGGGAHRRYTRCIDPKKARQRLAALRLVPPATILVVLGAVCLVYLVFIGCQVPYFFSAFAGATPEQYAVYSEYARAGFFELCRIASINLGLLALAGALYRRAAPGARAAGMRFFNILLSALTLLVLATAFSKMGLYIARYGLTPKRVMTCVFMVFLAGVCLAVVALQFKPFSIVRFAAVAGAALLCALCLCNLDGLVVRYNAAAWESGRLATFDALLVARGGPAGAGRAMAVYESLDEAADPEQKLRLAWALYHIRREALAVEGTSRDNLASRTARRVISLPMVDELPEDLTDRQAADWLSMDEYERYEWERQQMEPARRAFERHFEDQLERGGYE